MLRAFKSLVASIIPFDKDNAPDCDFESEDVQAAIEELCERASNSASPGYSWGDSGNVTSNSWLLNDTVPSNKTGRNFSFYNGLLTGISVSNENTSTFSIALYEHDGTTFTLLTTVTVTAARSGTFDETDFGVVTLTRNKELAIKLTAGSAKSPVVQLTAKGTTVP